MGDLDLALVARRVVMAGLVPAIHAAPHVRKVVDARVEPGHDE
jgi:hypothetical protein